MLVWESAEIFPRILYIEFICVISEPTLSCNAGNLLFLIPTVKIIAIHTFVSIWNFSVQKAETNHEWETFM
jgi:hypothetical protein